MNHLTVVTTEPTTAATSPMRRSVIATLTTDRHVIAVEDVFVVDAQVSVHQRYTVTVWSGDDVLERRYYGTSAEAVTVAHALAGYPLLAAS